MSSQHLLKKAKVLARLAQIFCARPSWLFIWAPENVSMVLLCTSFTSCHVAAIFSQMTFQNLQRNQIKQLILVDNILWTSVIAYISCLLTSCTLYPMSKASKCSLQATPHPSAFPLVD
mmetsp:Transcript_6280/g.8656  ORF Transcript_6280/g.8656 Transcript_6280/m.8656 type:complete len:118 (-) Transcript_6280:316-669(-)